MAPICGDTWSRARAGSKLLNAQKGFTFAVDCSLAQEFALTHRLLGSAAMLDSWPDRQMTVRLGDAVAYAQTGMVGSDGRIEAAALRLYGLPLTVLALPYCIVEEQRRGFGPGQARHRIGEPPRRTARPARAFTAGSK